MRRQDNGSDGGMEEGEVRVGALGGEGRAVGAVRLASLLFVVVVVVERYYHVKKNNLPFFTCS